MEEEPQITDDQREGLTLEDYPLTALTVEDFLAWSPGVTREQVDVALVIWGPEGSRR